MNSRFALPLIFFVLAAGACGVAGGEPNGPGSLEQAPASTVGTGGMPALANEPTGQRDCRFAGFDNPLKTPIFDDQALQPGSYIEGPAVVTTADTTYLVEPGWAYHASNRGAVWFFRI